jgi:hypothetical protein
MTELNENAQANDKPAASSGLEQISPDFETVEPSPSAESSATTEEARQAVEPDSSAKLSPGAIFFGLLVTLGFVAFVLLAKVTVHPFDKVDRRMKVLDVWTRLRNHLPEVAHPTMLRLIFDVSIIMIVVGSLACVWIALLAADTSGHSDHTHDAPATDPGALQTEH